MTAPDQATFVFPDPTPPAAPPPPPAPAAPRVWHVSDLTRRIKALLEKSAPDITVEGEISNLRLPASGHAYFVLKDASAQLRTVVYRSALAASRTPLRDGALVRARGRLTVYEARGEYQLLATRVDPAGQGELAARFEELKRRLAAEGLFDPARKRPLPLLPRTVGIVTSPTGAAIQDILNVINRRHPDLHLLLAPVRVQGEGASLEIAAAIDFLNTLPAPPDVLIVGRGGGSLEDLWAFNEEPVVRAIVRSRIPVISAVGHEIDTTLSDYAADLRAPTPSAAAELVVAAKDELLRRLDALRARLSQPLQAAILRARNRLDRAASAPHLRDPLQQLALRQQRIDHLALRLQTALSGLPALARQRAASALARQERALLAARDASRRALDATAAKLRLLDPANVLSRGYALARRATDSRLLRTPADAPPGTPILVQLAAGTLRATAADPEPATKGTAP